LSREIPRARIFAGPNGSGKSTLIERLKHLKSEKKINFSFGYYVNADEILHRISRQPFIRLDDYGLTLYQEDLVQFIPISNFAKKANLKETGNIYIKNNIISFIKVKKSPYLSAFIAEFIRYHLVKNMQSFTFETVMSHPSKIDFLKKLIDTGYKVYQYYVATGTPDINISRIKYRSEKGGHSVESKKVIKRYSRSLELLFKAIQFTHRAYVFDNSNELTLIAEINSAKTISLISTEVPSWFNNSVINKTV
jgi:predicted ABC-type ATPase